MKKGIDSKRNLCDNCKHNYPNCDGDPEFGDNIGNDNIIKCKQYKKKKSKIDRLEKGSEYYVYLYKDRTVSLSEFMPKMRVDNHNSVDTAYYECGNYFKSLEDCNKEIERVTKLKSK